MFLFFLVLPVTSDSRVEGEERCSTARGGFFHSEKEMRKRRENFILVNIMMPVLAERIVHPMTLAENVVLLGISAEQHEAVCFVCNPACEPRKRSG